MESGGLGVGVKQEPRDGALPSIERLVSRAAELRPVLAGAALETERSGRVSSESTELLQSAGLFNIMKRRAFGGYEMPPSAVVRVAYEIAQACGSTAWCLTVANTTSWYAAYWPSSVQEEMWGRSPGALVSGAVAPTGRAEKVDGGYLLSGRWPFASNCDNCDWMIVSAPAPSGGAEPPQTGWFMAPRSELEIDHASWSVSGLQGTGSKTCIATEPFFVPDERLVPYSAVVAGTTPGGAIEGNLPARFNFATFGSSCLAGTLLGMAQGALDCFVNGVKSKARAPLKGGAPVSSAQSGVIQCKIGEASAAIDAALALLLRDMEAAEAKVMRAEALSAAERVTLRRNAAFVARQAVLATNLLFESSGASTCDLAAPIQRFWRDVNAGARHATLDIDNNNAMAGQERLGLTVAGQY